MLSQVASFVQGCAATLAELSVVGVAPKEDRTQWQMQLSAISDCTVKYASLVSSFH